MLAAGPQWSAPTERGDTVTATAELPPTAPFGGMEFVFTFGGQKITRVEQQTLPAAPVAPTDLRLTPSAPTYASGFGASSR